MKVIIAYIRPSKEEAVREALRDVTGLSGASFSDVRGFGRGRSDSATETVIGSGKRVRVEVMATDLLSPGIESIISTAAHTGQRGDGKIYVLPLDDARRISTGEIGASGI